MVLALAGVGACAIERETVDDGGVHPVDFAEEESPNFHGGYLKKAGYPLSDCRQCHGDDYAGGAVGVSCNQANCHSQGVEWCGTCHEGGKAPPEPDSGGHTAHPFGCTTCHEVPKDARGPNHPSGEVEVHVTGLGALGDHTPTWSAAERVCSDTYCHGPKSPLWELPPQVLACDSCHGAPPATHVRFTTDPSTESCLGCHPAPPMAKHLNGTLDYDDHGCATCHGQLPSGQPPPALDGSMSPTSRGVGAHLRHTDPTLDDRMGRVAECTDCHVVPATTLAAGHIDTTAPSDVDLFDGTYDVETASCVTACHWERDPGPVWTDTSGAPRQCDACHGFPPTVTRTGTPHPVVESKVTVCETCHSFQVLTHVDGKVDFLQ